MSKHYQTGRSFQGAQWAFSDTDMDQIDLLMRRHELPELIARLLCIRKVPLEDVSSFLNPTFKKDFPDPFSLRGMGDMAEDVAIAIEDGQKFAIFGDFDVDGATSAAVLYRFLKACGVYAPVYIPDRLTEGYGPNIEALRQIKVQGADILMMLDCGTTAFDVIAAGAEIGLKIVILDHHEAEETLPAAWHVINPKRKEDMSGLTMMAAVGVTFMACVSINNRLRDRGFYSKNSISEPNLKSLIDLVALGTVCDMVPLTGINRLFVRAGFAVPYEKLNMGIRALMNTAKLNPPLSTFDCGFILGPRINAGSRIDKADLGAQLLCSDDMEECQNIAWMLHDCNEKRKAIQQEMEEQAIAKVQQNGLENDPLILVYDEAWHPGLSGLVAGRLKEKFKKPACVVTYAKNMKGITEGRGSGRSVAGVHIAQSFIDARHLGLVEKGGGHAMAGGFTVMPQKITALHDFLKDHVSRQLNGKDASSETIVDSIITVRGAEVDLVEMLHNHLGPFGQEYPEPLFVFRKVRIFSADILGGSHVRVMLSDWESGGRLKAMAFRAVGTPLGGVLLSGNSKPMDFLGYLKINNWQGKKTVEMHMLDAAYFVEETVQLAAAK